MLNERNKLDQETTKVHGDLSKIDVHDVIPDEFIRSTMTINKEAIEE